MLIALFGTEGFFRRLLSWKNKVEARDGDFEVVFNPLPSQVAPSSMDWEDPLQKDRRAEIAELARIQGLAPELEPVATRAERDAHKTRPTRRAALPSKQKPGEETGSTDENGSNEKNEEFEDIREIELIEDDWEDDAEDQHGDCHIEFPRGQTRQLALAARSRAKTARFRRSRASRMRRTGTDDSPTVAPVDSGVYDAVQLTNDADNTTLSIQPTESGRLRAVSLRAEVAGSDHAGLRVVRAQDSNANAAEATSSDQVLKVHNGLVDLTTNLKRIAIGLNALNVSSEEIMEVLRAVPAEMGRRLGAVDAIRQELVKQGMAQNEAALAMKVLPYMSDALEQLPALHDRQLEALRGIESRLASRENTEQQLVESVGKWSVMLDRLMDVLSRQREQVEELRSSQQKQYETFREAQIKSFALFQKKQEEAGESTRQSEDQRLELWRDSLGKLRRSNARSLKRFANSHREALSELGGAHRDTSKRAMRYAVAAGLAFFFCFTTALGLVSMSRSSAEKAMPQQAALVERLDDLARKMDRAPATPAAPETAAPETQPGETAQDNQGAEEASQPTNDDPAPTATPAAGDTVEE